MPPMSQIQEIDVQYYEWLISHIKVGPQKEYYELFELLHNTEFTWFIPNDDNRIGDGEQLRNHFMRSVHDRRYTPGDLKLEWISVLEVIIALSRRLEFIAGGDAPSWAWRLIKNLGLNKMPDPLSVRKTEKIKATLEDLIWRQYEPTGHGGFFPLKRTINDQTKVEIWYQMQEYVMEIEDTR
jgi:hypothetical protein